MELMTILRRICDGLETEICDRQKSLANIVVDFGAKLAINLATTLETDFL